MASLFDCAHSKIVYMCGDFNVDLLLYESHAVTKKIIDELFSYGLRPLISRPTIITKHSVTLIDNIFTTELHKPTKNGLLINDLSDHLQVFQICECAGNLHNRQTQCPGNRLMSETNIQDFCNDLSTTNWEDVLNNN